MYERNCHWENLTVQLGQFAAFLDRSNISVTKLFESLVNFRKNKSQKLLLTEVTKLAKLLLALLATNATSERSTRSRNRLNHCMLLHIHRKKTDQLYMTEIAKEFVGDNQARLQASGRF